MGINPIRKSQISIDNVLKGYIPKPLIPKIIKFGVVVGLAWQILIYLLFMRTWLDDYMYSMKGYMIFQGMVNWQNSVFNAYMPIPFLIHGFFQYLFGPSLFVIRVVSAIFLILTLFISYKLIKQAKSERAAVLFLTVMTLSPSMLQYLVSGSAYNLVSFLSVASLYILFKKHNSLPWVLLGSSIATLVFFTRNTMLPFVVVFQCAVWFFTKDYKKLLASIGMALLVCMAFFTFFNPSILLSMYFLPVVGKMFGSIGVESLIQNRPFAENVPLFGKRNLVQLVKFFYPNLLYSLLFGFSFVSFVFATRLKFKAKKPDPVLVLKMATLSVFVLGFIIHSLSLGYLICYVNYFGIVGGIFIALSIDSWIDKIKKFKGIVKIVTLALFIAILATSPLLTFNYSWYNLSMSYLYNIPKVFNTIPVYKVEQNEAEIFCEHIKPGAKIFPLMYNSTRLFEANRLPNEKFVFGFSFEYVLDKNTATVERCNKFNLEMVSSWLENETDTVVVAESYKNLLYNSNAGKELINLVDEKLKSHFTLKYKSGDISIYSRKG